MLYSPFALNISESIIEILFLNDTSYDNSTYYEKNYALKSSINREIINAKFKRQHEKVFNIYQILMKQNISNLYNINQKLSFDNLYIKLRSKVRDVLVEVGFHGDITLEQAENITSGTVEHYINFESASLEFKYEIPIENFFHKQHYFEGYMIARFSSQLEDEDSFLVNNIYLLGNYTTQLNEDATLLYYIIGNKICEEAYNKTLGYFVSFDLNRYDGALFYSFLVQGKNGTHLKPAYNGSQISLNEEMDKIFSKVSLKMENITKNYADYAGELYLAREMYIRNYWKPKTCLEEVTDFIFEVIFLNTSEYISGQISREHFKYENGTIKNGQSLYDLFRNTFYNKLAKLSIQLFNYNETIPKTGEVYPIFPKKTNNTIVDEYDLGLNWTVYTTSLR